MARRKKRSRSRHTRRGRVGALSFSLKKSNYLFLAAIAAGYFFGDKVNALFDKVTGSLDPKLVSALQLGAGFVIPTTVLKSQAGKIIGGVLIGAGLKGSLKAFGVISGYSDLMPIMGNLRKVSGIGYPLPGTEAYANSQMHVISGMGSHANESPIDGSGEAINF